MRVRFQTITVGGSATIAVAGLALLLVGCSQSRTRLAYITGTQNSIAAVRFNSKTGAGTAVVGSPYISGNAPSGVAVDPTNHFLYAANQDDNSISRFEIDLASGALKEILPRTAAGLSPIALTMDSGGKFLFVANQISNDVWLYSIGASGALSLASTAGVGSSPAGLTLLSSQNLLYVPLPNFSAIYGLSFSGGVLSPVGSSSNNPFPVSGGVETVAADPGGKFLYVPNPSLNTVTVVSIQSGGTLASGPGVFATLTTPVAATTDSSGNYLYVANFGSSNLSQYKVDSTTGSLSALSTSTVSTGANPSFFLLDPDGSFIFVGNGGARSISEFTVKSDGTLTSTSSTLQLAFPPRGLAVTR